eukprot:m.32261 g.32261  ORF g.32261 m.32261 type:complete len:91 (+) comp5495_c0_seq1:423-695(+)
MTRATKMGNPQGAAPTFVHYMGACLVCSHQAWQGSCWQRLLAHLRARAVTPSPTSFLFQANQQAMLPVNGGHGDCKIHERVCNLGERICH